MLEQPILINVMNITTWGFTKINVVPLQKTLMKVSPRLGKRLVCYLLLILIGNGLIPWFI